MISPSTMVIGQSKPPTMSPRTKVMPKNRPKTQSMMLSTSRATSGSTGAKT